MKNVLVFLLVFALSISSLQVSSQTSEPNWEYFAALEASVEHSIEITYGHLAAAGFFGVSLDISHELRGKVAFTVDVVLINCTLALAKCDQNKVGVEWRPK